MDKMRIGTVISGSVETNRDGETNSRLLQVSISDPEDIQTVEWAHAAGDDYNPPPGTAVIVVDLGEAWKVAIAADDLIDPSVLPGEREIYSQVAGVKQASLKLLVSGILEAHSITGVTGIDFVAIASKIDQIITDIHDVFNTWVPAPNDGGAALQVKWKAKFGTPPSSPSVASTNLKADK